jgi:hypothetical protein
MISQLSIPRPSPQANTTRRRFRVVEVPRVPLIADAAVPCIADEATECFQSKLSFEVAVSISSWFGDLHHTRLVVQQVHPLNEFFGIRLALARTTL